MRFLVREWALGLGGPEEKRGGKRRLYGDQENEVRRELRIHTGDSGPVEREGTLRNKLKPVEEVREEQEGGQSHSVDEEGQGACVGSGPCP